jgi:hypothetical protein
VECIVRGDWDDPHDRDYTRYCIGEPEQGQTWHRHCLEHVSYQKAQLHQGLDRIIQHLVPDVAENDLVLETMTALDKVSAVRKLVAARATKLLAEQQARLLDDDPPLRIDELLWQADEALDTCEQALTLCSRVLVHQAIYGDDTWLVELTRAGDWIGTALAELGDALPIAIR